MMINPYRVEDVRSYFISSKQCDMNMTTDKTGVKCIELIGASFLADEPSIFGEPNAEYIKKEIEWYQCQSLNVNDIYSGDREPPAAWQYAASPDGQINSNYGNLIYSDDNCFQYEHVLEELIANPNSRRAEMIYTRPTMWYQYNYKGMSDFICTNTVTYYIRDGKLDCVVQMRSNDVVYGYKNDYAWQKHVLGELANDLDVLPGKMIWQVQNMHVYEKHFDLIQPLPVPALVKVHQDVA